MPPEVVVSGLAVVDIIGKPVDLKHPPKRGGLQRIEGITLTTGGNVSNVGIDLAKLGFRVGAITRVGNDRLSRVLLSQYEEQGLDVSGVIVDEAAQTSATIVSVDRSGERTFLFTLGCAENFRSSDILGKPGLLETARCFVFGYLGLVSREMERELPVLFRTIKERFDTDIVLDTGGVPRKFSEAKLRQFLSFVDYCVPSFEEAVSLTGRKTPESIAGFLLDAGVRKAVGVKLGAKGSYIATRDRSAMLPAQKVKHVVDTTGAGDAFVAGFVAGIRKGLDPFAAARIGNAVAASCVTAIGASTAIQRLEHYL